MMTLSEVYFLVRVGSWGEDELEEYIQERASECEENAYNSGHADGFKEGTQDGMNIMYKEAVEMIKGLR